ncbi:hypothetical protein [Rhodococcus erythropolis]|nr:hypothetical protein [Rhodococcus erythropolis]
MSVDWGHVPGSSSLLLEFGVDAAGWGKAIPAAASSWARDKPRS